MSLQRHQSTLSVPSKAGAGGAVNPLQARRSASSFTKADDDTTSVRSGHSERRSVAGTAVSEFTAIKASLDVKLEHRAYYPGQVVRGTVRFTVRKPTKFYALRLRVAGKESMVVRKKKYASEVLTKQRTTFFKELVTLEGTTKMMQTLIGQKEKYRDQYTGPRQGQHGGVSGSAPILLAAPGEYVYPFEVQIPLDAVPSFEAIGEDDDYAAIIFYAKAYLDIPGGGESDLVARSFFRVVSLVGIKQWKAEAKPLVDHQEFKIEGCCGSSKGVVKVSAEVPRRLLSIADDKVIPFRVVVNNISGTEPINRVSVELVHVLTVVAEGEEEERRSVLASLSVAKTIEPGSTDGVIGSLPMPEDPPPSLVGILFSSKYFLIIVADVPFAQDPESVSELTLVQRCETVEEVQRVELGKQTTLPTVGLHEYKYVCPDSREADLRRVPITAAPRTAGSTLGLRMAADDADAFDAAADLPVQVIDRSKAPKRRPLARWKLVPPLDYGGGGDAGAAPDGDDESSSNRGDADEDVADFGARSTRSKAQSTRSKARTHKSVVSHAGL